MSSSVYVVVQGEVEHQAYSSGGCGKTFPDTDQDSDLQAQAIDSHKQHKR